MQNWIPVLSREAASANSIKDNCKISVVIGNPPYSGESSNDNDWINELMKTKLSHGADSFFKVDGENLGERNPKWINDDYVKFLRFAQHKIGNNHFGICCMITPHGFIDNPTFRGVRQSLMATYESISLIDLHGNTRKSEKSPDGSPDKNVFDIQQGVCISKMSLIKSSNKSVCKVKLMISTAQGKKYLALESYDPASEKFIEINPVGNFYLFSEFNANDWEEYSSWPSY